MQKYNGQLIRQFASSVSGNAASGVTVTVRRKSDNALATLYVDNNTAGATLSNPITTTDKGFFAFYAADGVYTLTFSDNTPQQVIQLQDVAALQDQFDSAVLNAGYIPSGTFAAGATLTQANQVLSDGSSYWRWDGSFPKTVTAGSAPVPTGVGGWVVLSDFALRGDLAGSNSTVPVGGILAKDLVNIGIRDGIETDLSGLWQLDGTKTVITGDSLSFNFYGYVSGYRAEPWDCPHGMRSWSFLLRDAIHMQDKDFVYGDSVLGVVTAGNITVTHALPNFTLGFNNRFSLLDVTSANAVFEFMVSKSNLLTDKIVLHLARIPSFAGRFDVYTDNGAGEVYAASVNMVPATDYLGYEPIIINVPYSVSGSHPNRPAKIIFKNWLASGGGAFPGQVKVALMGVGSKNTPVYLTGHGGYTAQMIASEYELRIGRYDPDVLIVIVGANDRYTLSPAQYESGYRNIITQALAENPQMRIVLMGAMPATDAGYVPESAVWNGYTMKEFLDVPARLAREFKLQYIDNYRAMLPRYASNLFDNVHLNFAGNTALFGVVAGELLRTPQPSIGHLNGISTYGFDSGGSLLGKQAINNDKTPAQNFFESFVTATISGGSWTIDEGQDSRKVVKSISIPADGRLMITTNYHLRASTLIPTALDVSAEQVGSSSTGLVTPRVFQMTRNTVTLIFLDAAGNLMTTAGLGTNNFKIRFTQ